MPQKKPKKLAVGTRVQIKQGVTIPESPEVSAAGWIGTVFEAKGRGATLKYILEWEDATLEAMPQDYINSCEEFGLYYRMACFDAESIEAAEE